MPKKDLQFPSSVTITEADGSVVEITVVVYYTGLYIALCVNGQPAHQCGHQDHRRGITAYLKDIQKAKARGAKVAEGVLRSLEQELARVAI